MSFVTGAISFLIRLYQFLIFLRVLLSWVNTDPYRPVIDHPLVHLLNRITDPVLAPLRRLIPAIGGMFDISPVIALIGLEIIRQIIVGLLWSL